MKKIMLVFLLLPLFGGLKAQNIKIKSLQTYLGNDQTALPIIANGSDGPSYITIEFDIKSTFRPDLNIVFRFCDKKWNPTNNIFLLNDGKNIAYSLDFSVLPSTVVAADFHYKGTFPDAAGFVKFPFSGKYRYYVTDASDTTMVYAQGKFVVIQNDLPLAATIKNDQLEDKTYFPSDLAKTFNITADFDLPKEFYPEYVDQLEIIENHKTAYPIIVDRNFNTNRRQYYWNGARRFTFTARDIRPGNNYRETDLRDINIFNSKNVNAQFDGLEYSRFFKEGPPDLNGGSIILNYKNDFATYLNVKFSVRPPDPTNRQIFLVGAFNNWRLLPGYEMIEKAGIYSLTVQLKRGAYDYQYVTADLINGKIADADWFALEGNSWETRNEYNIFLYYTDPQYGGYDRIIGYQKIMSNNLWKN